MFDMDAVMLCLKKRGIRFFSKIKFPNTLVTRFYGRESFLQSLRSRKSSFENVLIIGHGGTDAILTTSNDLHNPYHRYITESDADAFENDFVFAVSCLTAVEFGKSCVDAGCVAYLGYQVELGGLFSSSAGPRSGIPKRVAIAVNTIIKHIFVDELSRAYEEYLTRLMSVKVLKERFSFLLEQRIARLLHMTVEQIYEEYSIKINKRDYEKFAVQMVLCVLELLDEIIQRFVCIGDESFISPSYIIYRRKAGECSTKIIEDLENSPYFKELKNESYRQYLRDLAAV